MNPRRIDEIFETDAVAQEDGLVRDLGLAGHFENPVPTRRRSSNWMAMAVAVAVILPLSIWFALSLQEPQEGGQLAVGDGQSEAPDIRHVDFKPVLATAAASQRMAIAVKESSVAFLSRIAEVTGSESVVMPITESATLIHETADQWKAGRKTLGLAMMRLLASTPADPASPESGEAASSENP